MKSKNTFSVIVWAYRGKQKNNEATLYVRITVASKRAEISLRRKISLDKWDEKNARITGNSPEAAEINESIEVMRTDLRQLYYELKTAKAEISAEIIRNKYFGIEEEKKTFLQVFRQFNQQLLERKEIEIFPKGGTAVS